MPAHLKPPLLLLLLRLAALSTAVAAAAASSAVVEVFSFDYAWTPARPVPNDTVVFQASAPQAQVARWGLNDASFRWYQQLPGDSSGFQLRHVGRSYTRRADEAHFEGRYRLRVSVEAKQPVQPATSSSEEDGSDMLVDVVKYVGLQKQVEIALLTNGTAGRLASDGNSNSSSSRHHIVCRFWGWPLVDTLQFLPPAGSVCHRRYFESAESEPHIDLVLGCSKLLPGTYSCYGRNSVSPAQLSCELSGPGLTNTGCYRPSLTDGEAASASGGASSSSASSDSSAFKAAAAAAPDRKSLLPPEEKLGSAEAAAASGDARLRGVSAVVMTTGCLAIVMLAILR